MRLLAILALLLAAQVHAAPPMKTCWDGSRVRMNQSCPAQPAPAPAPTPTEPAPPVAPPAGYTVKQAAITCDGSTDTTATFKTALSQLGSYQMLQLPVGTCVTSDILVVLGKTNVMIVGAGKDATIIKALTPDRSAFIVTQSNGVIVQGFQVVSPNATARLQNGNSDGFYLFNSSNVTVDGVKVGKVAGAAVYFSNIQTGTIQNSETDGNLADSFHVTGASQNITVQFNKAYRGGDDCLASIGYQNSGQNKNISFLDNYCQDGAWAGGIGIEGTIGLKAYRNHIVRSGIACIRIDSQTNGGYNTAASDQIDLQDNVLEGCGTRTNTGHGSIMMYANYFYVHGVVGARNHILNPTSGAGIRAYGISATQDIQAAFAATEMVGVATPYSIGAYANVTHIGTTLNGSAVP